jgi:hypothetical protein
MSETELKMQVTSPATCPRCDAAIVLRDKVWNINTKNAAESLALVKLP